MNEHDVLVAAIEDEDLILEAFGLDAVPRGEEQLHIEYLRYTLLKRLRGDWRPKDFGEYMAALATSYLKEIAHRGEDDPTYRELLARTKAARSV